jgi:hypothetical protein
MTDERRDAEATKTRKRGPIVAGPEAREAEKPARSATPAGESPRKAQQEAETVAPTREKGKNPTPGP